MLLAVVTAGVVGSVAAWLYFFVLLPRDLPVPDLDLEPTPARLERGNYLANAVFGCIYCHSERDWSLFGAPPKAGRIGAGGEMFDESMGLSGMIVAPNITPYALGDWSDGEIYRAIVNGLHRDGYAFFPIMPFDVYLHLDTEDVYAIIAYLRTLPTVISTTPQRRPSRLMQFVGNVRALPANPWLVDRSDPVERGEYLGVIAGCRFCHTPADNRARALPGMQFAGGRAMLANSAPVYSANISPDPETGIGKWSEADFINRFKTFKGVRLATESVGMQTQHAWTEYAQMQPGDLADIYAWLMAQPPVRHAVDPLAGPR